MKISKKHARLIREGVRTAQTHTRTLTAIMSGNVNPNLVPVMMEFINETLPKHPLSLRAYIHTVEQKRRQNVAKMEELKQNMTELSHRIANVVKDRNAFKGEPEPPAPAPEPKKSNIRIADGFHD